MNFNEILNKAKAALGKNPSVIDKAGDLVDKQTGGKYSSHVDKAQDAAKKFTGGQQGQAPQGQQPQQPQPGQNPDQQQ